MNKKLEQVLELLLEFLQKITVAETERKEWLDAQEVMQLLHISSRTLQKMRTEKHLPHYKVDGKYIYLRAEIDRMICECRCVK